MKEFRQTDRTVSEIHSVNGRIHRVGADLCEHCIAGLSMTPRKAKLLGFQDHNTGTVLSKNAHFL